jgi:hypothetical protein
MPFVWVCKMSALALALIDLAVRITKWIVRNVARWTLRRVVAWMHKRVGVFQARWRDAYLQGNQRRQDWLAGRISRWLKAAEWLQENALEKLRETAQKVCTLPAFGKLPEYASCERLTSH